MEDKPGTINPVNGAIRFILELAAISTYGVWGFNQSETGLRIVLAVVLPLGFAVVWGVFAVRDDPSRSGKTVVQTPGWIRLVLELALFTLAAWMLLDMDQTLPGWIFAGIALFHYLFSLDRAAWLLKQK